MYRFVYTIITLQSSRTKIYGRWVKSPVIF